MDGACFPKATGKGVESWVHWERVSQRGTGLVLGERTGPHLLPPAEEAHRILP